MSTTVVAFAEPGAAQPHSIFDGEGLTGVRVFSRNISHEVATRNKYRIPLQTTYPWVPLVASKHVQPCEPDTVEFPTAILRAWSSDAAGRARQASAPFVLQSLVAAHLNVLKLAEDVDEQKARAIEHPLRQGFKYNQVGEEVRQFLHCVLLWTAARLATIGQTIKVRATYPLVFSPGERATYRDRLREACNDVSAWTSLDISLFGPWNRADAVEAKDLYCDEATALAYGASDYLQQYAPGGVDFREATWNRLVFHADLGGSTLDLMAALVENTDFRIVATESVKFGANCIIDRLQNQTHTVISQDLVPALIDRVRRGLLDEILDPQKSVDALEKVNVTWRSANNPSEDVGAVAAVCAVYAQLLNEYVARFLAGVICDRSALTARAASAPGHGDIAVNDSGKHVVSIGLSGNGWRLLDVPASKTNLHAWMTALEARVKQLIMDEKVTVTVDHLLVSPKRTPKWMTAFNAIHLTLPVVAGNGVALASPESAPNGWNEGTEKWYKWVGRGTVGTMPVAMVYRPEGPMLPTLPKSLSGDHQVQSLWNAVAKTTQKPTGTGQADGPLTSIREHQNTQAKMFLATSRVVSANRALHEAVLYRLLTASSGSTP
jgi:hypothetical protein